MAHNPIIKQTKLSMTPPEIGRTQRGVVRHQGVLQVLEPTTTLAWGERWSLRNSDFYLVDCREHDWNWSLRLESADEDHPFQFTIASTYVVNRPERVVEQNITDLERHLARKLTPALQTAAANRRLNDTGLSNRLLQIIEQHAAFEDAGVEPVEPIKINLELTSQDKEFIEELNTLAAAQTTPQRAARSGQLPTDGIYKFDATLTLQYRVTDLTRLRRLADVEQAVTWIWEGEIQRALRPVSRQFSVKQEARAEEALNAELSKLLFEAHGIRVVSASLDITPEAKAVEILSEDTALERQFELDTRRKAHVGANMRNRFDMLTQMVVRGELSYRDALAYMDGKEIEATNLPLETIKKLKELDILDIDTGSDAARILLTGTLAAAATKQNPAEAQMLVETMLRRLGGGAAAPSLPSESQSPQTEDDEADS